MTITRNFKLCLNAGTQNAPYINVNQYDEGEEWVFDLYTEGGQKFVPSTGAIIGIKSDGNAILNSGTVNASGQVVITETQQMTAASGLAVFELLIEGETHGTANFIVNVEQRPGDNADLSDSDLSLIQEAVDSAAEIEDLLGGQDVPTVITPIISDWLDENITNPSNPPIDTSLTVAGAAADAKATGDEIADLKGALNNLEITIPVGKVVNCWIVPGTTFTFRTADGSNFVNNSLILYDDELTTLQSYNMPPSANSRTITFTGSVTAKKIKANAQTVNVIVTNAWNIESVSDQIEYVSDQIEYVSGDLLLNKFIININDATLNGVSIKKENVSTIKLNGTASAGTNFNIAFGTIDLSVFKKVRFYIQSEAAHSASETYLQIGYLNESSSPVQMSNLVPFNTLYDMTFPDAAKKSRFYLHINSGATFSQETVQFFMYFDMQAEDDETVIENLTGNSFNSTYHTGLTGYSTPCTRFSLLMTGDTVNNVDAVKDCEAFLFFTDPHTQAGSYTSHFVEYMGQIQKVFNSVPAYFALCGGDWLGNSDTPDVACYKMGLIGATCRSMLKPCCMLVGNHDSSSATYTTRFPNESISNLWYAGKPAYFKFDGMNTRFYCFDTGVESQTLAQFDNYGYKQAQWFANALLSDNTEHIAIALHIYYTSGTNIGAITKQVMQIAAAYNNRTTITVNGTSYNFASAAGRIEFVIAGHMHQDSVVRYASGNADIPVIMTIDTGNRSTYPTDASFDLVFVDYDNREIKCIRVGSGSDRTVSLASVT